MTSSRRNRLIWTECRVIRDREAPGSNPGPPTISRVQNRRVRIYSRRLEVTAVSQIFGKLALRQLNTMTDLGRSDLDPHPKCASGCDMPAHATVKDRASHLFEKPSIGRLGAHG